MGILGWWQDRRRAKEIERDLQTQRGKAAVRRHITNQKRMCAKYWEMAKQALVLGDDRQFESIGRQYLRTQQDIKRWERYLLAFESIEARRDQARSTKEFLASIQAMSQSMLADANPRAVAEAQKDLGMAVDRARNVEQMLDYMMDTTDQMVSSFDELDDHQLQDSFRQMRGAMEREAPTKQEHAAATDGLDTRIAEGLRRIEQEARKDLNR